MKAKINHGNRGISQLPKGYDCTFEEAIVESIINGQKDQAIEYFNRMKHDDQINLLLSFSFGANAQDQYCVEAAIHIISNL